MPGDGAAVFTLTNTGMTGAQVPSAHPQDATAALAYDIYRLSVTIEGAGWSGRLRNALAAVRFGESARIPVTLARTPGGAASARVTMTAASESDSRARTTVTWVVSAPGAKK